MGKRKTQFSAKSAYGRAVLYVKNLETYKADLERELGTALKSIEAGKAILQELEKEGGK